MNQVSRIRAPIVELSPAEDKIVASIAFVIHQAERLSVEITQYDIVKALFFADKAHLNKYGRPVTFDNYVAMKYGPVPSFAYDLLKGNGSALSHMSLQQLSLQQPPWQSRPAYEISPNARFFFGSTFDPELDEVLSQTDIDALSAGLESIRNLTFGQIKRLTHEEPAYVEAWDPEASGSNPMSYSLLFDTPNQEQAELIGFLSKHRES